MEEKFVELFELVVSTIAGGLFVLTLGAYINDGTIPPRRRVVLFVSALIVIIGICMYFEVPIFWIIWDFIADMPWMEDVSETGVCIMTVLFFCIMVCIIIAIFISVWKGRSAPLSKELGFIAVTGLAVGLSLFLLGVILGLIGLMLGLEEPLRLYAIIPESLTMGLAGGLLGGLAGFILP